jgi:hypothetical protein
MKKLLTGLLVGLLVLNKGLAQEIPLGGWQTHFSYLSALHVVQVQNHFFCATYNGLFSYTPGPDSTHLYSKIDGLHDTGISSMAYDPGQKVLLLSYRSGNIDLMYFTDNGMPDQIVEWPLLRDTPGLPDDRRTHKVVFHEGLAYVGTTFGIVVLDPLQQEVHETYRYIGSQGAEVAVYDLAFSRDSLYASSAQGILRTSLAPEVNRQFYGNWTRVPAPFSVRHLAFFQDQLYTGNPGQGIYRKTTRDALWRVAYPSGSSRYVFRISNERLVVALDNRVVALNPQDQVTGFRDTALPAPREALLDAAGNLWAADSQQGLVSNYRGSFQSYSPPTGDTTLTSRSDSLVIDRNGLQWVRLPATLGGGIVVKNPTTQQQRYLSVSPNNGGLPSSLITSLSLDRNGLVWFAADRGVGYFLPDGVLGGKAVNAIYPLFGQRRLLSNEFSTALVTEPGNRKWVGTRNGLYLFSPEGMELIRQFTAQRSPLPSDQIRALRFDEATGRLYIDTPKGMVSYRSDATVPASVLTNITVFPNPVRPGYAGVVGIKGLRDDTVVKITDLAGRLVYETRSQGGTASWDLLDYTGRRARGGIYLVLVVAPDGSESKAGKLAVIE